LDLLKFDRLFHELYRPPRRRPVMGDYGMLAGVLMLLFIGFNRLWHFTYVRLDSLLCGFFHLNRLPVASTLCDIANYDRFSAKNWVTLLRPSGS
jgi:hypothetical protein